MITQLFYGIEFGDSLSAVQKKITAHSADPQVIAVTPPRLPLATHTETHLTCKNVHTRQEKIANVAFTFADNALVWVQAQGNAVAPLTAATTVQPVPMINMQVYREDLMAAQPETDTVSFFTRETAHPSLLGWRNPYIQSPPQQHSPSELTATIPHYLQFGQTIAALIPAITQASRFTQTENIADIWLPHAPATQTQINAYGIPYAGFGRKIEAVFGDNKLELVWIITAKQEEARIRQTLITTYGEPQFINEKWEAFSNWQIALRKDTPEVLLLSPTLAPIYKQKYEASSA